MLGRMRRPIWLAGAAAIVAAGGGSAWAASQGSEANGPRPAPRVLRTSAGSRPPAKIRVAARKADVFALESASSSRCKNPPPVHEHLITHRTWLTGVVITEYYPAPERWFAGKRVKAPGLPGRHAVDWLYSARGLAMEGSGVDAHGHPDHIAALGSTGWVNYGGHSTVPVCLGKWSDGPPAWLIGGWRNSRGQVTFPLASGGWANGRGGRLLGYGGVTFAPGNSLPLRYYHSIAVDPKLIPMGSRVFVPAYRHLGGGWFIAQDTGGAIRGRHIDVYRPAPASPSDLGRYMTGQRMLVIPPG